MMSRGWKDAKFIERGRVDKPFEPLIELLQNCSVFEPRLNFIRYFMKADTEYLDEHLSRTAKLAQFHQIFSAVLSHGSPRKVICHAEGSIPISSSVVAVMIRSSHRSSCSESVQDFIGVGTSLDFFESKTKLFDEYVSLAAKLSYFHPDAQDDIRLDVAIVPAEHTS